MRVVQVSQLEMERYQQDLRRLEEEMSGEKIVMERERVDLKLNYDLLVEREKGKLQETISMQEKELEGACSSEACRLHYNHTASQLQLQQEAIDKLREEVSGMKDELEKKEIQLKETKKKVFSEKAVSVGLKREVIELNAKISLLSIQLATSHTTLTIMSENLEGVKIREGKLREEIEVLRVDVEERRRSGLMERSTTDSEAREAAMLEQIKSLEWKVSERSNDVDSLEERMVMVVERHRCEVEALNVNYKSKCTELHTITTQVAELVRERLEMRARIVQFKQAITDILTQHTQISMETTYNTLELKINKVELQKLLDDDLSAQQHNRASGALKSTLNMLSDEICSLRSQVDKHTCAAQSSSLAWKELGEQVHDLQEICRSSAANRASHGHQATPPDPILQLPIEVSSLIGSSHEFSSTLEANP